MATMDSSAKNNDYVNQLLKEQESLNSQYSHAYKLLQQEIEKARNDSSDESQRRDSHIVVHSGKQIRVKVKVHIPVDEHPNFNFVGKLLGPKGSSLQQLQEATQTRMAILGRGSMRDKRKEEELRSQGDPKYSHLNEELHVEITAFAQGPEAYRRISGALAELQRFLVPDYFDAPPQFDGKGKPPFPGDAPPPMGPRGGPGLPPRPMGPPMMQGRGEPPRRGPMVQSTYAAPEGDEWAPPRPSPRRGGFAGAAPPPPAAARAARPYEEPVNDYNNYGDGYGDNNYGNAASYYDYSADTDGNFADGYGDARGPMRTGGAVAARGRANSRMTTHPYAGATRRGY
ncbi:KH domain-containing, RNA-binding, signal transduction-associated protein 2 isoform X2 [Parasteatoda tepidariorum]|uniref:KH domain-containing, RNA-binding, signal transduction-associated protein 2 isoform X2 n=1 Tax=Parasteatoda tepidariorum TaxID=114398 RepID=UPI00077FA539|nr:KH domain-containing, RNA-binding, signal transduction-associated protein 2 isoform X2 [Parasteatoda tepidariorum]